MVVLFNNLRDLNSVCFISIRIKRKMGMGLLQCRTEIFGMICHGKKLYLSDFMDI